jgi:ribosome recycling factor
MKETIKTAEEKMGKTVAALEREYGAVRAGRASPAILDKINIDYYGVPTPVPQMASVSVVEARSLLITPWDASVVKLIEKAILTSDIGINPVNDGKTIRLNFPPLTEERRKELVKEIRKMAEDSKVAIRSIRRDAIEKFKAMKKDSEITEDEMKKGESDIQKLTDKFVKIIDETADAKDKEILEI